MRTRVELEDQPFEFIRTLAPEPRKRLRRALHELERGRGDVKALQGAFTGYWRLRAATYRVVFRYAIDRGQRVARCIFVENRSVVYDLFAEQLQALAKRGSSGKE